MSVYGWDKTHDRPLLRLESELALDGFELRAFGADYEDADTMFAVFAGDERILTRRPEPLLISYLEDIIENEAFTLLVEGHNPRGVELNEERVERLERVKSKLEDGLEDAPLKP